MTPLRIFLVAISGVVCCATGHAADLDEIARKVRENQEHLYHVSGGFRQSYELTVTQPDPPRHFKGTYSEAEWAIRYPKMHSRVIFTPFDRPDDPQVHEVVYDVETGTSVQGVHVGGDTPSTLNVALMPYCSAELRNYCLPVQFLFLPESESTLFEGRRFRPPPIPECFEDSGEYTVEPDRVDGKSCFYIHRPGYDSIWACPELGYSLLRRKVEAKAGGPAEFSYSDHRQVGEAWVPHRIVRTVETDSEPFVTTVQLQSAVSPVSKGHFQYDIPAGSYVSDQYRNKFFQLGGDTPRQRETRIAKGKRLLSTVQPETYSYSYIWFALGCVGWALFAFLFRTSRRRTV